MIIGMVHTRGSVRRALAAVGVVVALVDMVATVAAVDVVDGIL